MTRALGWTGATFLLGTADANAHLVQTGFGPFYDGFSHLLATPEELIPVVAIAVLAGLSGPRFGRAVLLAVPACWLAGGMLGLQRSVETTSPALTTVSFLVLGGLVAADRRLPFRFIVGLGAVVGFGHGYLNGTAMSGGELGVPGLVGVGAAVFVIVSLAAALVVTVRAGGARVAIRVLGSWIASVGLLLLGWAFRGGA